MNSKVYAAYAGMIAYQKTQQFQEVYRRRHNIGKRSDSKIPITEESLKVTPEPTINVKL